MRTANPAGHRRAPGGGDIAGVLKGYPRLSETFIAQEILALQQRGFRLQLVSLRHPTDRKRHPVHDEIRAPVCYLPEFLYQEPLRVRRGWWRERRRQLGRASCRERECQYGSSSVGTVSVKKKKN